MQDCFTSGDDHALVEALRGNDTSHAAAALKQLVQQYRDGLYNYVAHVLHGTDGVDDLLQDLFARLWIGRHTLAITTSVRAYLYRSAYHRALDDLAHKKRVAHVEIDDPSADAVDTTDAASAIEATDLDSAIQTAITRLPRRCRQIFVLARQEGLSYPEIAESLGISVGTVKTQMSRAVQALLVAAKPFLVVTLIALFG